MAVPQEQMTIELPAAEHQEPEKASETKVEEPKKVEKSALSPEEGLEKLKKQLEEEQKRTAEERQARIAAENRAREAATAEVEAKTESHTTQLDLIKSAISSLTQANDALEEKYAAALQAQDYAGAAKVQREMGANEARLLELNRGKTNMESAPKVTPRAPEDPVERLCSQLTPASASWVRAHPEFARDSTKYRRMIAAHELAVADGHSADSPEYFSAIEETLKIAPTRVETRFEEDPSHDAAQLSERPSRQPPSAPVSRSGNGTGSSRRNVVTLTPEQVEIAKMMKMTPEEYAKELLELKKEGKIN